MPTTKTPPFTKIIDNISVSASDIHIDPARSLWFRRFTPTITESHWHSHMPLPLMVYFHGGGFTLFGPDTWIYDYICSLLAAKVPAVIVSVNYRLAPDHKCPSQYDDGFDALRFIDSQSDAVLPAFTDLGSCFIGGDSAGANIAHHVTVRALRNAHHFDMIRISGLVSVQPLFGGEERTGSEMRLPRHPIYNVEETDLRWQYFLPEGVDRNHPAVNVFGGGSNSATAEELKSLAFPTTLVVLGRKDPLLDWQKRYVQWLKNCGKKVELTMYPKADHGFYAEPYLPEFDLLLLRVMNFIHKHMHIY